MTVLRDRGAARTRAYWRLRAEILPGRSNTIAVTLGEEIAIAARGRCHGASNARCEDARPSTQNSPSGSNSGLTE